MFFVLLDESTHLTSFLCIVAWIIGVEINLAPFDSESTPGVAITSLPTKGDLFEINEDGSTGRKIESPYQLYDVGGVFEQYVSEVISVSSSLFIIFSLIHSFYLLSYPLLFALAISSSLLSFPPHSHPLLVSIICSPLR